jgi:geranylgeranyl pyrophosphate synthase
VHGGERAQTVWGVVSMELAALRVPAQDLVQADLARVEELLRQRDAEQHEIVAAEVNRLLDGGGKRLRPTLVLHSAHLCGADTDRAVYAAAAVELLHTATLVHDDLIDGSPVRRGVQTMSSHWSAGTTVMVGDYLFARAAFLASQTDSVRLMRRFAETLMTICSGEVRQMFDGQGGLVTRDEYIRRIYAKTASLISMASQAGASLSGIDGEEAEALRTYGDSLGLAFQIVDDVLDFVADEETLGKPVGGDLRQGLVTLPLLLFLEEEPDQPAVRQAIRAGARGEIVQEAVELIARSSAIERSLDIARDHGERARSALRVFPESSHREGLSALVGFAVDRRF